jgi:protein SCO1/2
VAARIQLTLAAVLVVVAVGLGAVLVLGDGPASSSASEFTVGPSGFAGSERPLDIPVRDFRLRDQDGRVASLSADRGKVVVLTFLYSTCQDTCPVTASQVLGALDDLPDKGATVPALAVSVDPAHDTPALARRFLLNRRITGRMRFLLGTRAELSPVWKSYGISPQGDAGDDSAFEHSAYVLLLDKHGRQRISFPTDQLTPAALAHDIRKLQAEPG